MFLTVHLEEGLGWSSWISATFFKEDHLRSTIPKFCQIWSSDSEREDQMWKFKGWLSSWMNRRNFGFYLKWSSHKDHPIQVWLKAIYIIIFIILPRYRWNIVESGIKHHKSTNQSISWLEFDLLNYPHIYMFYILLRQKW
jgi:hypothetical protein